MVRNEIIKWFGSITLPSDVQLCEMPAVVEHKRPSTTTKHAWMIENRILEMHSSEPFAKSMSKAQTQQQQRALTINRITISMRAHAVGTIAVIII